MWVRTDIDRRLYEHNIGHSKFTPTGITRKLVYREDFDELITSKRRELRIKMMKSKKYIESMINSAR